jgi:hypothetical protein
MWRVTSIALVLISLATATDGAVLYSNLGAGDSYSTAGYSVANNFTVAGSFIPVSSSYLGSVDLGLNYNRFVSPNQRIASVALASDSSGTPGPVIEQLGSVTASGASDLTSSGVVTAFSTSHSFLSAGTKYWIVLSAVSGNDDSWKINTTSDPNRSGTKFSTNNWNVGGSNPAFRVNDVPEPALVAPLFFAATFLRRWR